MAPRRSSAVAVTLVAWLLVLQVLVLSPVPAAAAPARISPGAFKQVYTFLFKKAAKSGTTALIKKRRGSRNGDQLGSAAADNAGYVVLYNVSIGATATATQQNNVSGVVDVLNDFVWTTQCPAAPLSVPCGSQTCRSVTNTTDACDGGNTSVNASCGYVYMYGQGINTTGFLANETVGVGSIAGRALLGCSAANSTVPLDGESAGIGFNRGPLSLVSQLGISRFSYFLATDEPGSSDSESVVLLGDAAVPQTKTSRSMPMLRSTVFPNFYYVKLTSIQIDGVALSGIPAGAFDLAADGSSGGVVISTLSPVTLLQAAAYDAVRQALVRKVKSEPVNGSALAGGAFDLCYNAQSVAALTFPKIKLVFGGGDAPAIELTTVHYFYKDNVTGLQCLTMLPTPAGVPFGSVLGSMVQAGTNMIYDVGGETLTLEEGTAAPAPSQLSLMAIASVLFAWVLLF
ncbi:hypothetical protein CFC21_099065 [Triticum aestivum]|uniref:Peptidase A1 domain-containing protein n=2 Tax=Triticum aestivum TaxID=4565 RepID=A0A3B6R899_WHEAT|nr:aspartic proteinase nepenthesin-1-like [Triticum aestivum]KAF7097218.1 hypothetical protein CFC21_099065 [Triticum aestivum]